MVAIKDRKMPKTCANCPFNDYGDGHYRCAVTDSSIDVDNIALKRLDNCPLVEIGTCKDCKNAIESHYNKCICCTLLGCNCNEDFYCKDFEKRGNEDGSN